MKNILGCYLMLHPTLAISNEESIQGNREQVMEFKTYMKIKIDKDFNKKFIDICEKENIPAALIDSNLLSRFNRTYELDHGSIVPLHFINKYYNNYKLVHITYAAIGNIDLYRFGIVLKKLLIC